MTRRPLLRVMRARCWSLSLSDGRFYGWRWWLHVGPIIILAGRG